MGSIEIRQNEYPGMTFVPNEFVDRFMAKAPGEYVKIYLYLLRCLYDKEACFSFARAAQLFDSSEGDIRRALGYWEDAGLLSLECRGNAVTGISMCTADMFPHTADRSGSTAAEAQTSSDRDPGTVPEYSASKLRAFCAGDEISQVIFVAEQYLGHRLRHRELCFFCCWSEMLSFSPDLIIDLVDRCVTNGCSDMEQLHALALEWHENGIRTPQEAHDFMKNRRANVQKAEAQTSLREKVCRALGITGRSLNDAECARIEKWSQDWLFSDEMICEACRRTVANTHQASFEYAETILRNWYRAHITDPEGVRAEDEAFYSRRNAGQRSCIKSADTAGKHHSKYGELELLTMANI